MSHYQTTSPSLYEGLPAPLSTGGDWQRVIGLLALFALVAVLLSVALAGTASAPAGKAGAQDWHGNVAGSAGLTQ